MIIQFNITKHNAFYNIKLKNDFVLRQFKNVINLDINKMINKTTNPETILFDYSSPNVAKEMHVGHLRSTIIGDTLANFYEFLGHNVVRINHIGDFGLQFGMMVNYIEQNNLIEKIDELDLQELYIKSNDLAKSSESFNKESHEKTYELQNNIEPAISIHKKICEKSRKHFQANYDLLGTKKILEIGESFYQNLISKMIDELDDSGLLEKENGRTIIKTNINNKELMLTIIKTDGAYTYDTTDLCAVKYRIQNMNVDKIFYIVDSGQSDHFKQIFQVSKKMCWINNDSQLTHLDFGLVLGLDGKRMRSRDGGTLKLLDLFDESIKQTKKVMIEKNRSIAEEDIINLAIGSIKYADLKSDRKLNYKFSYDKMLSFSGNTLCYIMYGYVRSMKVMSNYYDYHFKISDDIKEDELNDTDLDLIKFMLRFSECVEKIKTSNEINHLTTYLFELVKLVHHEYNTNRVIEFNLEIKQPISSNNSRINIFILANKIISLSFEILNIKPLKSM